MTEDFTYDQQVTYDGSFESFGDDSGNQQQVQHSNGQGQQQSSDDASEDSRKIFVGGMPWETTEDDLKQHFAPYGEVQKCTIKIDPTTGRSRGFGFLVFAQEASVEKAVKATHMIRNKKCDVKVAKPHREPQKKVFCGGLDPSVAEEQMREYFGQFGTIENLEIPFDKVKNQRKSFIFIVYSTESEAKKAARNPKQEIQGRTCDVKIAVPPEVAKAQAAGWDAWGGYDGYGGTGYGAANYGYGYGYGYSGYGSYGYDASGYGGSGYGASAGGASASGGAYPSYEGYDQSFYVPPGDTGYGSFTGGQDWNGSGYTNAYSQSTEGYGQSRGGGKMVGRGGRGGAPRGGGGDRGGARGGGAGGERGGRGGSFPRFRPYTRGRGGPPTQ